MNVDCKPKSCENFELLLSCCLDGETSPKEQEQLATHLAICDPCRDRSQRFEAVNSAVYQLGEPAADRFVTTRPVSGSNQALPVYKSTFSNNLRRLAYLGLAASAMIVFLVLNLNDYFTPRVNANELLAPMVALAEINTERIRDQEFLRETLKLDLRTLKLELAAVDRDNSNELILERIRMLMDRLGRFESARLN